MEALPVDGHHRIPRGKRQRRRHHAEHKANGKNDDRPR
jgi:hypothetical protein